jgi:hypothetical protein
MRDDDPTEGNKAARMMRRATLRELLHPSGADATADKLQAFARSLVDKAAGGDLSAIKEVLDRIDGKTPAAASEIDDISKQVSVQSCPPECCGLCRGMDTTLTILNFAAVPKRVCRRDRSPSDTRQQSREAAPPHVRRFAVSLRARPVLRHPRYGASNEPDLDPNNDRRLSWSGSANGSAQSF